MPLSIGGTEVYIHTLASLQKTAGHDVSVLTPHFEYYRPGQLKEHYVHEGIDVYQFAEPSEPLNRQRLDGKRDREGLENFERFVRAFRPDIIHFHELTRSIGFSVEHVKIAKNAGIKTILTMHLSALTCNTNTLIYNNRLCKGKIRELDCSICSMKTLSGVPPIASFPVATFSIFSAGLGITKKLPAGRLRTLLSFPLVIQRIKKELAELVNHTDHFVSLTKWYERILIDNGVPGEKITVIPQALAAAGKIRVENKAAAEGLPLRIIFIGRIQPQKGVDLLIDAVKGFTPDEVTVDIYGREEDTAYYRQCIVSATSVAPVTFKGVIAREEVLDKLAGYDILCLPSTFSEMSPLVIQEAFAAGIPVLASKVYGNAEQIKDGHNGMLFDFKSSKSLRQQIEKLLIQPSLLGKMRMNIHPPDNFDSINSRYMQLYKQD